MVDVCNKCCDHPECPTRSIFDVKDGKGRFCQDYKLDGIINIKDACCEKM